MMLIITCAKGSGDMLPLNIFDKNGAICCILGVPKLVIIQYLTARWHDYRIKIKLHEGFSFKVSFFLPFAGLPKSPKTMSLLPKSLKIITSAPQLPENK